MEETNTKQSSMYRSSMYPSEPYMITNEMVLKEKYASGKIDKLRVAKECTALIYSIDKFSSHIIVHRVVNNNGKNYINCSIHLDYHTMIHQELINDCHYCFMLSTRVEHVIVVVVVCLINGKLDRLTSHQLNDLNTAVESFKIKYELKDEMYGYTSLGMRRKDVVHNRNDPSLRAHSAHFHLKIFLSEPIKDSRLIVLDMLDMTKLRILEPIDYSFTGARSSQESVINAIRKDLRS